MLTGQIQKLEDIPEDDMRRHFPRFQPENFETNLVLVKQLQKIAEEKGCTPAQLAISWTISQSKKKGNPEIIPIPGATTVERIEENSKLVDFTDEELEEIDATLEKGTIVGGRYGGQQAGLIEGWLTQWLLARSRRKLDKMQWICSSG